MRVSNFVSLHDFHIVCGALLSVATFDSFSIALLLDLSSTYYSNCFATVCFATTANTGFTLCHGAWKFPDVKFAIIFKFAFAAQCALHDVAHFR